MIPKLWPIIGALSMVTGCATGPGSQAPKAASAAPGPVAIAMTAPYAPGAQVPANVRKDCDLERKVPQIIRAELGNMGTYSDTVPTASGRSLDLSITEVVARLGGGFTGPKAITVRGTLYENGVQTGSFTARRSDPYGQIVCLMLTRATGEMARRPGRTASSAKRSKGYFTSPSSFALSMYSAAFSFMNASIWSTPTFTSSKPLFAASAFISGSALSAAHRSEMRFRAAAGVDFGMPMPR
jgi:hypothetical protein